MRACIKVPLEKGLLINTSEKATITQDDHTHDKGRWGGGQEGGGEIGEDKNWSVQNAQHDPV